MCDSQSLIGVLPVTFTAELYSAGLPNVEFEVFAAAVEEALPAELLVAFSSDFVEAFATAEDVLPAADVVVDLLVGFAEVVEFAAML